MGQTKKEFEEIQEKNSIPSFLEPEKSNIENIDFQKEFTNLSNRVLEGYDNGLKAYVMLTELEKQAKATKEKVKENAIAEFENYDLKTVEDFGSKISIAQSGRYSYKNSDSWVLLEKQRKDIEKKMQNAYKAKCSFVDEETGEIFEMAEYTPNKKSLKIS